MALEISFCGVVTHCQQRSLKAHKSEISEVSLEITLRRGFPVFPPGQAVIFIRNHIIFQQKSMQNASF